MLLRMAAMPLLLFILAGCSGTPSTSDNPEGDQNATITIDDNKFSPSTRNVHKGSVVTWMNSDSIKHTATAHAADGTILFDSGDIAAGASWPRTFDTVGTFEYHCDIHPSMQGTITVTE